MLRILKDCILCGISVHTGETYPIVDFDESDLAVVIGAGFAERFTPEVAEKPVEAAETVETDETTSKQKTPAKTTRKRKK